MIDGNAAEYTNSAKRIEQLDRFDVKSASELHNVHADFLGLFRLWQLVMSNGLGDPERLSQFIPIGSQPCLNRPEGAEPRL
jgi:hypothetical protein